MWNKVRNQKLYKTYIFYKRVPKFSWKFNDKVGGLTRNCTWKRLWRQISNKC